MAGPDFSVLFGGAESPTNAIMQGLQTGALMGKANAERDAIAAKMQRQAQMSADFAELAKNPTTQAIAQMAIRYPDQSENLKRPFDMLDPKERQVKLEHMGQVFSAVNNDKPEIAKDLLKRQIEAYRNSGNEPEAKASEAHLRMLETDPVQFKMSGGILLSSILGPEKFGATFETLGKEARAGELQPGLVRKGNADADGAVYDATTKGVTAKYAERTALADLEKKGWDIKKIQADIVSQRESNRIAAMNAAYNKESNELKREELRLKISDATRERDDKVRDKAAKVESAVASMDNMLNTVERLMKNPGLNDVVGSLEGSALYPNQVAAAANFANPLTSSGDDRADAIALIDTLGSQAFLSQVPNIQGMGALSNAEGEKLQQALQNFGRKQSENQFRANLEEVKRLVGKSREMVGRRYGVPVSAPNTPAAPQAQAPALPAGWSVQER